MTCCIIPTSVRETVGSTTPVAFGATGTARSPISLTTCGWTIVPPLASAA